MAVQRDHGLEEDIIVKHLVNSTVSRKIMFSDKFDGNAAGIFHVVLTEDGVVPSRSEIILFGRVTLVKNGGEKVP